MLLESKNIIDVLEQEVKWCEQNIDELYLKYQKGFIDGLLQAKRIISIVVNSLCKSPIEENKEVDDEL